MSADYWDIDVSLLLRRHFGPDRRASGRAHAVQILGEVGARTLVKPA